MDVWKVILIPAALGLFYLLASSGQDKTHHIWPRNVEPDQD